MGDESGPRAHADRQEDRGIRGGREKDSQGEPVMIEEQREGDRKRGVDKGMDRVERERESEGHLPHPGGAGYDAVCEGDWSQNRRFKRWSFQK